MISISRGKQILAALAIATMAFSGLGAATQAHAAPAMRTSVYAALAGTWLGPGIGDSGGCGQEYGQFTFFRNQEFAYTSNSADCGGFTLAGNYWIQNRVIYLHWTECNYPCSPNTVPARFAFISYSAFELADQYRTYVYYRQ
jgi:hypothetical protein